MGVTASLRARRVVRDWQVSRDPRSIAVYVLVVDAAAILWSVLALIHPYAAHDWTAFGLLGGLAVVFEESARRTGRLQFRMSAELKRDMTSVWSVSAAIALTPSLAVVLHVVVLGYLWFRQQRPAGEIFYRKFCSSCAALLGCLVAGRVMHAVLSGSSAGSAVVLAEAMSSVFMVILVHGFVNRALITGALLCLGARGAKLIGTKDANVLELATLCLGGLVGLTALVQPWLCVLVFVPMIVLQRAAFVRDLDVAATTDTKTGLLNAVAWDQVAQAELARGQRDGQPVAVLIVDIDRFKTVNDRYGHLAGDDVLKAMGRCLRDAVRVYDTVGRFGGEEFVAVLPGADEAAALVVAERLRSTVHRLRVSDVVAEVPAPRDGEPDDRLAVSVGVALAPVDGAELSDVLHAADGALYCAKESGRNRVVLAHREGDAERAPLAG